MINRRAFFAAALTAAAAMTGPAAAHISPGKKKSKKAFVLDPLYRPQMVDFPGYEPGTVVIETKRHFLYLVLTPGEALRYGVGVGKAGLAFRGTAMVGRKAEWPRWQPTKNMIARDPKKYARFADGVAGGPKNPLGARALYLYRNGRDTMFRIHGTTEPSSIGRSVSNGCIRMINEHVIDLYERVPVGATVIVKQE
jgi:lipoprotein-anchoring transpeptidase ErfK/SrfK